MAEALHGSRSDAGLSTTQLATRFGWSWSTVSKTERAVTLPSPSDVEAWLPATGAAAELRAELIKLARRAGAELTQWRRRLAPGRRRVQEETQRLEQDVQE